MSPTNATKPADEREPYIPSDADWGDAWEMLCGYCRHRTNCQIVEAMIETKDGGPWPEGGWVSDPGAGVTCLSYEPVRRDPMPRQQLRHILRLKESALPPVCGGCAARKGSEASVSLHTRRDYAAAVQDRALFACHEDPALKRPCGGWCRAVRRRAAK